MFDLHGSSRFECVFPDRLEKIANRLGWRIENEEHNWEYYVTTTGFHEMCQGYPFSQIAKSLIEKGFMTGGKNTPTITKSIAGYKKQRLYCFSASNIEKMSRKFALDE